MRGSRGRILALAAALGAAGLIVLAFGGGPAPQEGQELLGLGGAAEAQRWAARSEQLVLDQESEAKHLFFECEGEDKARACMTTAGKCLETAEADIAALYAKDPRKATEERPGALCRCFQTSGCAPQCTVALYMLWATQTKLQCPMQQPDYVPEAHAWRYGDPNDASPGANQFSRDYYPTYPNPGGFNYKGKVYNYAFDTPGSPTVRAHDFDGDGRPDAYSVDYDHDGRPDAYYTAGGARPTVRAHDFDGDGRPDAYSIDYDHDGRPDAYVTAGGARPTVRAHDFDGDGRPDAYTYDWNHDGKPDAYVFDRHGDGRPDAYAYDTDHDGRPDTYGWDRDGDGRPDVYAHDFNHDGRPDTYSYDWNGDGIPDAYGYDYNQDGVPDRLAPAAQYYYPGAGDRQAWPSEALPPGHRRYDSTNIYYKPLARDNYRLRFPRRAPQQPAAAPPPPAPQEQPRVVAPRPQEQPQVEQDTIGSVGFRYQPNVWYLPRFHRSEVSSKAGTGPAMVNWVMGKDV